MTVSDLGNWLAERSLRVAAGHSAGGWWAQLSNAGEEWIEFGSTLGQALESVRASYDLRDCVGLPEVREVDGTCL
jgi:hypothetical protein